MTHPTQYGVRRDNVAAARYPEWRALSIRYVLPALLLAATLIVAGCASMSKNECLAADWYTIGVEDGSMGKPVSRIGAHRKACAEVGVQPDMASYTQGRDEGLLQFCTGERGYSEGKRGSTYNNVCPPHLENTFMQGYLAGQQIYKTNEEIRRLERELEEVNNEVAEIRFDMEAGHRIAKDGLVIPISQYERDAMYERLLALGKEEGRLEGEISVLRNSIAGS